jgi:plasmid stabilization system protein ParE
MTRRVSIAPSAQKQLEELASWWSINRPASATNVVQEYQRVVELIAQMPLLGRPYRRRQARNIRHYPLAGTPYQVFYALKSDTDELRIIAIWSAQRGEGPPI